MNNLSEYTTFAIDTAKKCGSILMEYFHKETLDITRKGYNDITTEADLAAEKHAIDAIKQTFPKHKILAEESGGKITDTEYLWVIDPLDGTSNFQHRLPIFAVSIALQINGELHCGVIYNPRTDELFYAEKGKGAYLNDKKITVSDKHEKEMCMLATGFTPKQGIIEKNLPHFEHFMKTGHMIRRLGAAAIDLAYTACGKFDGFWEFGLNPWDVAAGILLVQEAGGTVTDKEGEEIKINSPSIVASNSKMHEKIIQMLKN